jgi:hypothetical protein
MAQPFYFVSLPLASLVAGMELLTWTAPGIHRLVLLVGESLRLGILFAIASDLLSDLRDTPRFANLLVAPFAVLFASAFMLWRTLRRRKECEPSLSEAGQRRKASLLLIVFVWALLTLSDFLFRVNGPR